MIVVYTAIFGNYDSLAAVHDVPGVRFVAFTDSEINAKGWESIIPEKTEKTGRMENRKYKTRPNVLFPNAEFTIYMDGNLKLTKDPVSIVEECKGGLNVFNHDLRGCAYDEADVVSGRFPKGVTEKQTRRYINEGFPKGYGLYWGGLIIRDRGANSFNNFWWNELKSGIERDQVSLPYAIWSTGVELNVLEGEIPFGGGSNKYCVRSPHTRGIQ